MLNYRFGNAGLRWSMYEVECLADGRSTYPHMSQRTLAHIIFSWDELRRSRASIYNALRRYDASLLEADREAAYEAEAQRSASLSIIANPKKVI